MRRDTEWQCNHLVRGDHHAYKHHLIWGLTAVSLLTPGSVSVVRAQAEKHASHVIVRGPLPEAVRQATESFRDVSDAMAAGYVQNGGCVSGPEEGAMGFTLRNPRCSMGMSTWTIPKCWSTNRRTGAST
jgi:hypothetical protein